MYCPYPVSYTHLDVYKRQALSSIINFFLSTQGQISAVGTIISAGYGFLCGAYMPISSFSNGLQKIISFLPGTYGTSPVSYTHLDVYKRQSVDFPPPFGPVITSISPSSTVKLTSDKISDCRPSSKTSYDKCSTCNTAKSLPFLLPA